MTLRDEALACVRHDHDRVRAYLDSVEEAVAASSPDGPTALVPIGDWDVFEALLAILARATPQALSAERVADAVHEFFVDYRSFNRRVIKEHHQ
jgi:hypothetical protein